MRVKSNITSRSILVSFCSHELPTIQVQNLAEAACVTHRLVASLARRSWGKSVDCSLPSHVEREVDLLAIKMGEITLKCKKRRKVLEIFHREFSESDKKDSKEQMSCENYEDFIDDESVSEILKDVRSFDHLLNEHLEAFETSESENEDLEVFGSELQHLLSDVSTEDVEDEQELSNKCVKAQEGCEDVDIFGNELQRLLSDDSTLVDNNVEESTVRWKKARDPEVFEKLIESKVEMVKQPPSNVVALINLETGESSSVKLENQVAVDFHHDVDKDTFDKRLDTREEETKLKKKTAVSGEDIRAPYRGSKRGTLGVCYKFEMCEFEEVLGSEAGTVQPDPIDQLSCSTDSDETMASGSGVTTKRSKKKKFKHYKEFIIQRRTHYDPAVLSRLLSVATRKNTRRKKRRFTLIDGDTSSDDSSEDVDSPSSDISVTDCDDDISTASEKVTTDEISDQVTAANEENEQHSDSMPLIE